MKFIDLFCGIGGFRLALEKCGCECVFSSDIDEHARATYYANFGEMPAGDITKIEAADIPAHDILCAGFPCQAFSIAGQPHQKRKRDKGEHDARRDLINEVIRIAKHHKPRIMLLENVPALQQGKNKPYYKKILDDLYDAGYHVYVSKLTASDFGIPQKRTRLYFVCLHKEFDAVYDEPEPTNEPCCLRDVLEPEVDEKYFIKDTARLRWLDKKQGDYNVIARFPGGRQGNRVFSKGGVSATLSSSNNRSCLIALVDGKNRQGDRLYSPDAPACTQTANGGGRGGRTGMYHIDKRVRRLTPRESLRVMGFPDTHKIVGNDTQAYKQAGNAVIPQMIEAVFRGIRQPFD